MTAPHSGNRVELLENGDDFYPTCYQAFEGAKREILIETFILCEDKVGHELKRALIAATRRGIRVELTLDAWGSMDLSSEFIDSMLRAGVCIHLFEQRKRRWLLRIAWLRRLHRKLIVVDGEKAFIGGINFSEDHLSSFGAHAKQDYAALIEGPAVQDIHKAALECIAAVHNRDNHILNQGNQFLGDADSMQVTFIARDNTAERRSTIENSYRQVARRAKQRLIIANAYFFPSYGLLSDICDAARRGVDVRLIVQGNPDLWIARFSATLLYDFLQKYGIRIYEYTKRHFHGKLALVDEDWTTVGSSNLDPLSLWFNLEANIIVRDETFNHTLYKQLDELMRNDCREVESSSPQQKHISHRLASAFGLQCTRRFPQLARLFPLRSPRMQRLKTSAATTTAPSAWKSAWPRIRIALNLLFFGAVAVLLVINARRVDWAAVVSTLGDYEIALLLAAAGLAAAGHLIYTSYDVLGSAYTGSRLPRPRVMSIAFVSYAFNLNMGPLVGGLGVRFRLYSKQGIKGSVISRMIGFSIVSNWLGYLLLAGALFTFPHIELPADWAMGATALRILGLTALFCIAFYLIACARSKRRTFKIRGVEIDLPRMGTALLQLGLSSLSWLTMGAILFVLLGQQIAYPTVMSVLLLAAIAAVAVHIPAGLGVLEATFVVLLGHLIPDQELLAAVLGYRAVYYLAPLLVATLVFLWLESRTRRS